MSWEGFGGTTSSPVVLCLFEIVSAHVCREKESSTGSTGEWERECKWSGQHWRQARRTLKRHANYSKEKWQDTVLDGIRARSSDIFHRPGASTNYGRKVFSFNGAKIWNSLPLEARQLKSMHASSVLCITRDPAACFLSHPCMFPFFYWVP